MTGPRPIESLLVVVPARDEQDLLPRCLASLTVAIEAVHAAREADPPEVSVVIVLDRCADETGRVAAGWPGFVSIRTDAGVVGAARRAGIEHALARAPDAVGRTWIASTDADSAVPPNWLTTQLAFARNNVDLVLGTVRPDAEASGAATKRWLAEHRLEEGHPHVHGANLGVRADRYLEAGGFACVDAHEDVLLVARLRVLGVREARTALIPVLTSGRLAGRTPAGFAGYLREQEHAGG